ncbi:MAG: lipopolysaccharide heptosyltransferase I [Campylobacterota bacterium]|nr:lipopolysaccharide heptosyltransferase I [Campylobacterota bacterium]
MKICIVKLSAMGDVIHAMVALEFIKKRFPDSEIDWIIESGFKGVIENNPYIDNILTLNLKKIKTQKSEIFNQIRLVKRYAKNNYDIIIDAQGLIKSAIVSKMLKGKNTTLYGFSKNSIREGVASWFYDEVIAIAYDENTIDRNVTVLCKPLGIDVTSQNILEKRIFLYFQDEDKIALKKEYNLIVIGSTWESRNYPKEKFIAVIERLKIPTYIVWGSDEEYEKALWMEKQSSFLEILPKGNLNTLKSVIANAKLLIGNDTGPTHMAWGLNIPSITIFGPTPINRVYITAINKVIKSSSEVNHYRLNKNDFSINEIEVEDIVKIAKELLA